MKSSRWFVIGLVFVIGIVLLQPVPAQSQNRGWERFYEENLDHFVQFGLENGVNLAWAHRFQETNFLRYGLDLRLEDGTRDDKWVRPDTTTWQNESTDQFNIRLHVDYLKPVYPYEAVRLYIGAGPLFGLTWSNDEFSEPVDPNLGLPNEKRTSEYQSWEMGARALVGGEYALNSRLSFFAEVSFDVVHIWSKSEQKRNDLRYDANSDSYSMEYSVYTVENKDWDIDMSNVMIGVTFRYGEAP